MKRTQILAMIVATFAAISFSVMFVVAKSEARERRAVEEQRRLEREAAVHVEIRRALEALAAKERAGTASAEDAARIRELKKKISELRVQNGASSR